MAPPGPEIVVVTEAGVTAGPCVSHLERLGGVVGLAHDFPCRRVDVVIVAPSMADPARVADQLATVRTAGAPAVLVLLADAHPDAAVRLLEAGADDCLRPPHNPREVAARVRALLRARARTARAGLGAGWSLGPHRFDELGQAVHAPDGRAVRLTARQARLLGALARRPGEVVSREQLLEEIFGGDFDGYDRTVDVTVSRLRRRLSAIGAEGMIRSYRGIGYVLETSGVPTDRAV